MERPAADIDQEASTKVSSRHGSVWASGPRNLHLANLAIITGAVAIFASVLWNAVLASILAMFNVDSCCCLLGMPVGIWSLIVLMRPDVKAMFH